MRLTLLLYKAHTCQHVTNSTLINLSEMLHCILETGLIIHTYGEMYCACGGLKVDYSLFDSIQFTHLAAK